MGDHYAVVDWMVGDYRLKGVKKYGVMMADLVKYPNVDWKNIHTYLVDINVFEYVKDLKKIITYDVIGEYKGKAYAGKGQRNSVEKFYRINNNYIETNYP